MRVFISVAALLVLATLVEIGLGNAQGDGVRRITPEAARTALNNGRAIIVDVRSDSAYNSGHIRGARLIPLEEIGSRSRELPHDKLIITYCA